MIEAQYGFAVPRRRDAWVFAFSVAEFEVTNRCRLQTALKFADVCDMELRLEQMARSLAESGDCRVTSRLEPQAKCHPILAAMYKSSCTSVPPGIEGAFSPQAENSLKTTKYAVFRHAEFCVSRHSGSRKSDTR